MESRKQKQKTDKASGPRFKIEKLEERIAPAKGGLPGPGNGGRGGHNHSWGKS